MSKRGRDRTELLSGTAAPGNSLQFADELIYGMIDKADATRQVAEPVSLFAIRPDPTQPRRARPSDVDIYNAKPDMLFDIWLDLAIREETGDGATSAAEEWLKDLLLGDPEEKWNAIGKPGPIMAALLEVISLAASIYRDGLNNPITVVEDEAGYRLETGERRWLAYVLLHQYFGEDWEKIPARVMPAFNVWRQAAENNARANLNAISKARQLALLLMDLYKREGVEFQPLSAFEHEQDFYAQVADGELYRIPRGKGQILLVALGLKDPGQLRQYRDLLDIPNHFWVYADDHNLTEGEIRNAKKRGYTVTPVTVDPPPLSSGLVERISNSFAQEWQKFTRYERKFKEVGESEKTQISQLIDEHMKRLAKLKKKLQG